MAEVDSITLSESETRMVWELACAQYGAFAPARRMEPADALKAGFMPALHQATTEFIRARLVASEGLTVTPHQAALVRVKLTFGGQER